MAESSVHQIQQRLTCPICLDKFNQPKLLPCQHTFCLTPCLVNLVDRQTRRIKCPECRTTHMLPVNGVEQFPNNLTIMGFLDLDLSQVERNGSSITSDKCSLCSQRRENLIKCLDCSKMFCSDCKVTHVAELKNENKQIISNLRRTIPKLSEKVGNFEQKQTIIRQNYESIKHDITSMVDRLIEELRTRERCLHAEAEVYMESQLRTAGLEQENAEIELASVSSFCDSSETILNRVEQAQDNEIALVKKQAINFNEEMKSLSIILNTAVNKLKFKSPNLDDLFGNIQNFGELTLLIHNTNYNNQPNTNPQYQTHQNITPVPEINNINYNNNQLQNENLLNATIPQQPDYRRRRPTWNRNNADIEFENHNNSARTEPMNNTLPLSNRNISQSSANNPTATRSIFGPNPFATNNNNSGQDSQRGNRNTNSNFSEHSRNTNNNNIADQESQRNIRNRNVTNNENSNQRNQSNPPVRPRSRPIFGAGGGGVSGGAGGASNVTARSADNPISNRRPQSPSSPPSSNRRPVPAPRQQSPGNIQRQRPPLGRSDTFEIENPSNTLVPPRIRPSQTMNDNSDRNELYDVRRRPRARTPVTFAVMLDEPESNIRFDVPTNNSILTESLLNNPVIDYANKRKAKQIIGKQGREPGEFVWPLGAAINPIGKHILVADSSNHRVQIFESNGKFVKSIGSQGTRDGQFDCISDVTVDAMANLYVVDRHNHRIQIFDRYCRFVRSTGSGPGPGAGELNFPWGICVNRFSEIFVCDKENNRVCVFHINGKFMRSFGQLGSRPGQFDKPYYVHVTSENKVLVSDCSNHRIQIFDPYGTVLNCIGTEGSGPCQFKHPRGIVTDAEGFILVADSGNSRIQVIRPDGSFVCEFGSAGTESGKFKGLEGLVINSSGDVVIADKENHRIQIL